MKIPIAFLIVLLTTAMPAAEDAIRSPAGLNENWTLAVGCADGIADIHFPEKLKGAIPVRLESGAIDIRKHTGVFRPEKSVAVLFNEFRVEKNRNISIGFSADWFMSVYLNGKLVYDTDRSGAGNQSTDFSPEDHAFVLPAKAGRNLLAIKVRAGSNGWKMFCGEPRPSMKFTANEQWKLVDMKDIVVKPGSPLDLRAASALPLDAAKKLQWLRIGTSGRLEVSGRQVRLNGASLPLNTLIGFYGRPCSHEEIDRLMELARIQGYNFFRFGTVDALCKSTDKEIDRDWLDRIDYVLYSMARHGIYAHLIVMSGACYKRPGEMKNSNDSKARFYLGDPELRNLWAFGAEALLNHVNPYSGLAWKDDPVIASAEFYNELEGGFLWPPSMSKETRAECTKQFRAWLKAKYKTPEALASAWGGAAPKSFDEIEAPERLRPNKLMGACGDDFVLFCGERARQSYDWCEATFRKLGYQGLLGQFDCPDWIDNIAVRYEKSQIALAHKYFNHPTQQSVPGSICRQDSSLATAAGYWRAANATRFADRPFLITEINHAFWNKHKYEMGLVVGAYSALQGLDARVVHCDAVRLNSNWYFDAWAVALNPVARAGEFLSACLFLRGDVAASPHRVDMAIPQEMRKSFLAISSEQSKIALLCGFAVNFPGAPKPEGLGTPKAPDMTILPQGGSAISANNWFNDIVESRSSGSGLERIANEMKVRGILSRDNESAPSKGIFQSDTGEITMRVNESMMKVLTPRSEAVALLEGKSEKIGRLTVVSSSEAALVAACAVDGKELAKSRRIVLLYSTDAVNSNFECSGDRTRLLKLGNPPPLMKTGKLLATLENDEAGGFSLHALGFDGGRREKLPLAISGKTLHLEIDTATLKQGPTPFFELSK